MLGASQIHLPYGGGVKIDRSLSGGTVTLLNEALLEGAYETPLWNTFLTCLRKALKLEFAILHFRPPGRPIEETLNLVSGDVSDKVIRDVNRKYFYSQDDDASQNMEEGKVYCLNELIAVIGGPVKDFHQYLESEAISGLRQLRVQEATGVNAWLTVVRQGNDFSQDDEALLVAITPVLRGVLRNYIALERERFVSTLSSEAARRLQFGWFALDSEAKVIDKDDEGLRIVGESGVLFISPSGHLRAKSQALEKEIATVLDQITKGKVRRSYAITLSRDPWLDMLLVPSSSKSIATGSPPVAVAYVHGDSWRSADCCEQLAELFALTPSEAKMALSVCRGMTITEAAEAMGISEGTARSYTKIIYGKTGAKGLPDLVRIVMRSVLAMVPPA